MGFLTSKKTRRFGYAIYGILLTCTFLYYRFPSDSFCEYFATNFNNIFPKYGLLIDNISPSLPFGLKLINARINTLQNNARQIDIEKLYLEPMILSYFHGDLKYRFSANIYGGGLNGQIYFPDGVIGSPFTAELKMEDLNIGENSILPNLTGQHMEGLLSGNILFNSKDGFIQGSSGDGVLYISDGYIRLPKPVLSLESINFNRLQIKLTLSNMRLNLIGLELRSNEMFAEASGSLLLNKDLPLSNLDIRGNIEPNADLLKIITSFQDTTTSLRNRLKEGKIPFVIQGTILMPVVEFI